MKSYLILLLPLLALPASAAEEPVKIPMRDAATHDDIVEIARKAREEKPQHVFEPAEGEDPSVVNRPGDLLERSDILSIRGVATLVPKRAILHRPKEVEAYLGLKEGSVFITWPDFLRQNRSWITTVSVSRTQAEGNDPLPEETLKSFEKERRLVVAVYQDGPISVLPLKVPDPVVAQTPQSGVTSSTPTSPAP